MALAGLDTTPLSLGAALALLVVWWSARHVGFAAAEALRVPDAGLLTLGTVAAAAFAVPVVPVGEAIIAVNLGGAVVPVVLATALWRRGAVGPLAGFGGVVIVALVANGSVAFIPDQGVVSTFPAFTFPAIAATGWGLAVLPRGLHRAAATAYVSGSVGVLVGADLMNLPGIVAAARAANAPTTLTVGGAGALDLVFLTGAAALVVTATLATVIAPDDASRRRPARVALLDADAARDRAAHDDSEVAAAVRLWVLADEAMLAGHWSEAVSLAHEAAEAFAPPPSDAPAMDTSPARVALNGLAARAAKQGATRSDAERALEALGRVAAAVVAVDGVPGIEAVPDVPHPPEPAGARVRVWAFLLDVGVVAASVGVVAFVAHGGDLGAFTDLGTLASTAVFLVPAGIAYATLFEGLGGATPGKALLGVRVVAADAGECGLYRAFVRNTLRSLWVAGWLFGLVSLLGDGVLLRWDEMRRRVGDVLAETVVVEG